MCPELARKVRDSILASLEVARLKNPVYAEIYKSRIAIVDKLFGDDGLCGMSKDLEESLGLKAWVEYAEKSHGWLIRYKNCNSTNQFHSYFDPSTFKILKRDWLAPDGEIYQKPHGPTFLQHAMVRAKYGDRKGTMPMRDTVDFYARAGRTATDIQNPIVEISRLHGLMNSCGINEAAFRFYENFEQGVLKRCPEIKIDDEYIPRNFEAAREYDRMRQKSQYSGTNAFNLKWHERPQFTRNMDVYFTGMEQAGKSWFSTYGAGRMIVPRGEVPYVVYYSK